MLGALAGYVASGGKAENVSIATAIAASGFANNYLFHEEARRKADLENALIACASGGNCAAADIDAMKEELVGLRVLDAARDQALMNACQNPVSGACVAAVREAVAAKNSYLGTSDGFKDLWNDNAHAGQMASVGGFGSNPLLAESVNGVGIGAVEPRRVCRRLQLLSGDGASCARQRTSIPPKRASVPFDWFRTLLGSMRVAGRQSCRFPRRSAVPSSTSAKARSRHSIRCG